MIRSENNSRQKSVVPTKIQNTAALKHDEPCDEYSDPDLEDFSDNPFDSPRKDCVSSVQPIIYELSIIEETKLRKSITLFYDTQQDLIPKYRDASLRWLMKINDYFGLPTDCLYLAGIYFDVLLCTTPITKSDVQLYICVCYWISSKLDCRKQPSVEDFNKVACTNFTQQDFIQTEQIIFKALDHKLTYPTSKMFLRHYVTSIRCSMDIIDLSNSLCEMSFSKFDFFGIKHSIIAKSSVIVAATALNAVSVVRRILSEDCNKESLNDCCQKMVKFAEELKICQLSEPIQIIE